MAGAEAVPAARKVRVDPRGPQNPLRPHVGPRYVDPLDYGRKVVYYGNVQDSREEAPMRISFTHIPDVGLEQD